jgi:5-formyltetrahydrofolate cyclo-ligase
MNIPEAIRHPRGLSLTGPWPDSHGSHLTFRRQRIFQQTAMAVPSPSPKARLRADAIAARRDYARSLTPELREDLEKKLAAILLPRLAGAGCVAAYHPMRDEISPLRVLDALAAGQAAALPWFTDRDSRMIFRAAPASEIGPWGVLQPPASAQALSPDVLLVPLVLGDRQGTRIGQGKGHYDRAIAHLREGGHVFTIGIAWESQIAEEPLPADPWDMPLDAVATPAEWIDCRAQAGENPPASG